MTNLDIIRQGYEAFARRDIPAMLSAYAPAVTFTIPGPKETPLARGWRGIDDMKEFFRVVDSELEFTEFSPQQWIAEGDRVIVIGTYAGNVKRNGNPFRTDWVMAWRLENGKIVEMREYNDTLAWATAYGVAPRAAGA